VEPRRDRKTKETLSGDNGGSVAQAGIKGKKVPAAAAVGREKGHDERYRGSTAPLHD